mmetsp:Transcript_3843/g.7383  ORF Transcript_3843/g.7383 Transcript_3843/m.7383 type:complete len:150 (+) Transcript_3843:952-1401(+)
MIWTAITTSFVIVPTVCVCDCAARVAIWSYISRSRIKSHYTQMNPRRTGSSSWDDGGRTRILTFGFVVVEKAVDSWHIVPIFRCECVFNVAEKKPSSSSVGVIQDGILLPWVPNTWSMASHRRGRNNCRCRFSPRRGSLFVPLDGDPAV